jgi:L-rhamnose mutarotase
MSIFTFGPQLFLYMEVEDYAEAARVLAEIDKSVQWEEYMAPIMESATSDTYNPANAYPEGLPEVFYWMKPSEG